MESIKERAMGAWADYEYRVGCLYQNCFIDGFIAGAMSERSELLRWRDPKEELPEEGEDVLIKMSTGKCVVGFYLERLNWHGPDGVIDDYVSGWRPIHKL